MRFDILTIFPKVFEAFLRESLVGKAVAKKILEVNLVDIRSFARDTHRTVDDRPYGGGPGMVLKIEPLYEALKSVKALKKNKAKGPLVVLLSPQGAKLRQSLVKSISARRRVVLICGHYEGIDERISNFVDLELSIGDYVLNGGEVPAMVVVESVARMLPGFAKETESIEQDSFFDGLLDWPSYTRPAEFKAMKVPEVLLKGNHAQIKQWRRSEALKRTKIKKPYLIKEREKNG